MTVEERLERIEKNQERILSILHKAAGNLQQKEWVEWEEAKGYLNFSREWYKSQRNYTGKLLEGKDYRRVGGKIEYRVKSLLQLKDELIKETRPATHRLLPTD